jgi:hypothetical protein
MSDETQKKQREDLALDALLAAAFTHDLCDEDAAELERFSAALTPEEATSLESGSKDRMAKLFDGSPPAPKAVKQRGGTLATALNRADENQELSDEAKREMERKIREAEEAKKNKHEQENRGDQNDDGR